MGQVKRPAKTQPKAIYSTETLRPIVCLAFVLPMLFVYELGSIFADQMSGKSGIDQWLQIIMEHAGIGHLVVLPLVTAGILLYWHHQISDNWRIDPKVLAGMLAESTGLGIILFFAGNAVGQMISAGNDQTVLAIADASSQSSINTTITYIGCGVYEELIFRLMLLSGLIYVCKEYVRDLEAKTFSIVVTSFIFAILHYDLINPAGSEFDLYGFVFRFSASVIFCLLFLFRGFGIAVGTHVIYDVMTQM